MREEDVSEARASVAQPTRQSEPAENMPSHHCGSGRFECTGSRLQRGTRRSTRRHHHTSSSSPLLFLSSLSPVKLHDFTHTHITHSRTCDDKGVKKKKARNSRNTSEGAKEEQGVAITSLAEYPCSLYSTPSPSALLSAVGGGGHTRDGPGGGRGVAAAEMLLLAYCLAVRRPLLRCCFFRG